MPKDTSEAIQVVGLAGFVKDLRELGPAFTKELGQANKQAADVVAKGASTRAAQLGGVAAHVAPSIKAAARAREAIVTLGNDSYPMALGAEYGSKQYPQFKPWRGNQWAPDVDNGVGYFLHPAIREKRDEFDTVYLAAFSRVAEHAFPD